MGSKGYCFDNAVAESFFATLEKDLLRRRSFATRQDARTAVFDYIETRWVHKLCRASSIPRILQRDRINEPYGRPAWSRRRSPRR